jgi:hypothetical protein
MAQSAQIEHGGLRITISSSATWDYSKLGKAMEALKAPHGQNDKVRSWPGHRSQLLIQGIPPSSATQAEHPTARCYTAPVKTSVIGNLALQYGKLYGKVFTDIRLPSRRKIVTLRQRYRGLNKILDSEVGRALRREFSFGVNRL